MDEDSIEGVRPATGELAPDVWAAKLLDQLEPGAARAPIEESVEQDDADESQWQAALAAAHARAAAEPVAMPPPAVPHDGIADETGPHDTTDGRGAEAGARVAIAESSPIAVDAEAAQRLASPAPVASHAPAASHVPPPIPEAALKTAPGFAAPEAAAPAAAGEAIEPVAGHGDAPTGPHDAYAADDDAEAHHAEAHHAEAHHAEAHAPADDADERIAEDDAAGDAAVDDALAAAVAELPALVELLRGGRCILCVGPRLGSHPLTIRDALARLVATLPSEDVRNVWPVLQARPLTAAGFVARRLGQTFPSLSDRGRRPRQRAARGRRAPWGRCRSAAS